MRGVEMAPKSTQGFLRPLLRHKCIAEVVVVVAVLKYESQKFINREGIQFLVVDSDPCMAGVKAQEQKYLHNIIPVTPI